MINFGFQTKLIKHLGVTGGVFVIMITEVIVIVNCNTNIETIFETSKLFLSNFTIFRVFIPNNPLWGKSVKPFCINL